MKIRVNDRELETQDPSTILEICHLIGMSGDYFAVAVNDHFVPRHLYASVFLHDGDRLHILSPMQGG